ncbi:hypothetical protein DL769_001705 [Monosporascus sp. CRB-8-3]|nr:hypothetical protein DL769_001705 [Monosporascus sp. CRB-8-3]
MSSGFSLGRIQAGFMQAAQELTVAAANLNFDFTLVKLEAPPEYRAIGDHLSPSRIREAETGPLHMTARKLGALFEDMCPHTPNLIKAYGMRASEISREVTEIDSDSLRGGNWIRTEYGGIDATSIWAAATSSKAALPIHLLACIIARMWKHTEATSLWVELVSERKRAIVSAFENGDPIQTAMASAVQQEITRDHLAKWDASARAWLQTADKARQRQEPNKDGWKRAIHEPILNYLDEEKQATLAVSLGRRRPKFLPDVLTADRKALFQLAYLPTLLFLLKDADNKIELLRRLGSRIDGLNRANSIILCFEDTKFKTHRVFASVFGYEEDEKDCPEARKRRGKHSRWIDVPPAFDSPGRHQNISPEERGGNSEEGSSGPAIHPTSLLNKPSSDSENPQNEQPKSPEAESLHSGTEDSLDDYSLGHQDHWDSAIEHAGVHDSKDNRYIDQGDPIPIHKPDTNTVMGRDPKFGNLDLYAGFDATYTIRNSEPGDLTTNEDCRYNITNEDESGIDVVSVIDVTEPEEVYSGVINKQYEALRAEYLERIQRKHSEEKVQYLGSEKGSWCHNPDIDTVTYSEDPGKVYRFLLGQQEDSGPLEYFPACEHAAIYAEVGFEPSDLNDTVVTVDDILWCFHSNLIDPNRLSTVLKAEPAFEFLQVLSAIFTIYQELATSGATITCRIVNSVFNPPIFRKPLERHEWFEAHAHLSITQQAAIRLIGHFETGYDVIEGLATNYNIIGLSGGDSIYVLASTVGQRDADVNIIEVVVSVRDAAL